MATKTFRVKEHKELAHNPSVKWWGAIGPPAGCGDLCGQLKHLAAGETNTGLTDCGMEQWPEKVNSTLFTIFSGDCKTSNDGMKSPQPALSVQTVPPEYGGSYNLGIGQPVGQIMLPLSLTSDDGPIYVNPKQYNGILRRRKSRAKAVLENRVTRNRKPFLHYSRHLHAMRRPRGTGGRFLNTKKSDSVQDGIGAKRTGDVLLFQPTGSQTSEILQSNSGTLNSSKDANDGASIVSGSEVTSMYSRGDLQQFRFNHLLPSVHHFSGMVSSRRGIVIPSKWVAAADNCCNLKA